MSKRFLVSGVVSLLAVILSGPAFADGGYEIQESELLLHLKGKFTAGWPFWPCTVSYTSWYTTGSEPTMGTPNRFSPS